MSNESDQQDRKHYYQGLSCTCKQCQELTNEGRLAKQQRIHEARRRGGQVRAAQPSMQEARSKGFWTTMERHPFFGMKFLRRKMKAQNRIRMFRRVIPSRPLQPRKPRPKQQRPPFW
jgi:hypothetical protein